jgi:hypothetical protein
MMQYRYLVYMEKRKISLIWSEHVHSSMKTGRPPEYLEDVKRRSFGWNGDNFFLTEEDFTQLNEKWFQGPKSMARSNSVSALALNAEPMVKSRGLGDTIEKATKAFGVSSCGGCKKRRDKLNKMVPYRQ